MYIKELNNMKELIAVLFGLVPFCGFCKCDSTFVMPRHELVLTVNNSSLYDIAGAAGGGMYDSPHPLFNIQGRYMCNLNRHIALGTMVGDGRHIGSSENCIYTNVTFRAYWFNKPHFGMYSLVGVGPAFRWDRNSFKLDGSFNLVPVGMEFGWTHIRGFVELAGIGNVGVLAGGLKCNF